MPTNYILLVFIFTTSVAVLALLIKNWRWLPVILLPVIWFIPRQAVPNGLFENIIFLRWITLIILPLIIFIQFVKMAVNSQSVTSTKISIPLILFTLINIFSGIVNEAKPLEIIGSLLLYIRYPLLFIVFVNMKIEDKVFNVLIKLFLTLFILQIPECLFRFGIMKIHGDYISWTLGPWGAFDLGVYSILAILIILSRGIVRGFKISYFVLFFCSFIMALIGEIKAFLISAPLVSIITLYYGMPDKRIQKRLMLIVVPLVMLLLFYITYQVWGSVHTASGNTLGVYLDKLVQIIKNPLGLFVQTDKLELSNSRIFGSVFIWNIIKNDWRMIIMGAGPGSLLAGNLFGAPGKMFEVSQYLNQITITLGEVGIVGLGFYYIMLFTLLKMILNLKIKPDNLNLTAYRAAWIGMWVFYTLLGPFYDLFWRHDSPNFIFYAMAAFLVSQAGYNDKE